MFKNEINVLKEISKSISNRIFFDKLNIDTP